MLFFSAACALPAAAPGWVDITWMSISNMYYELGSKYILTDGYFTRIPQSEFFDGWGGLGLNRVEMLQDGLFTLKADGSQIVQTGEPTEIAVSNLRFLFRTCPIAAEAPLRLDMLPVTWDDHEMQSMLARGKRRSGCGGLRPSASALPLVGLVFLASATASLVTAQTSASQTSTQRRTVWDGVYTEAQAARGMMAFGQSCAGCHALAAQGKAPLVGDPFWKSFAQKTVGDLLEFVSTYMPNGTPGSLTEPTYRDIVALMLKSNGFPAGTTELGGNATANVQIVEKDGRTELPANALARVVGCLARSGADLSKSGTDWVITSATAPERAERVAPAGEDATRPLGSRTIPLKLVVTKLDALAGSRVAVSGLLIGEGGVDGINVTTVNRVAPKCP
ncbi:MAG: cytochrome c [Acidobacteriia bacterium]|nr:cytochrome c [Terriglobia bacterium]